MESNLLSLYPSTANFTHNTSPSLRTTSRTCQQIATSQRQIIPACRLRREEPSPASNVTPSGRRQPRTKVYCCHGRYKERPEPTRLRLSSVRRVIRRGDESKLCSSPAPRVQVSYWCVNRGGPATRLVLYTRLHGAGHTVLTGLSPLVYTSTQI